MSSERKPDWLKVRAPGGERYAAIKRRLRGLTLHTVCEEAHCPNMGECWGGGTATIMILGGVCSRGCRFRAVPSGRPPALDESEPDRVAEAVAELGLDYVVVTSVTRDDLPDGGASVFARAIHAMRARRPGLLVEVLTPDFGGDTAAVQIVLDAAPEVFAHNVETVERLQRTVRDPRCGYETSLRVLEHASRHAVSARALVKSSLMVGLGETPEEIRQTLRDLRAAGCDVVTLGQYLRPSREHVEVVEYVAPQRFEEYRALALELGFAYCASGPLVRSSYRAGEHFVREQLSRPRFEGPCAPAEATLPARS